MLCVDLSIRIMFCCSERANMRRHPIRLGGVDQIHHLVASPCAMNGGFCTHVRKTVNINNGFVNQVGARRRRENETSHIVPDAINETSFKYKREVFTVGAPFLVRNCVLPHKMSLPLVVTAHLVRSQAATLRTCPRSRMKPILSPSSRCMHMQYFVYTEG